MLPAEFAERVGVHPNTIWRILRADRERPVKERRIPGVKVITTGNRHSYIIPEAAVGKFSRRKAVSSNISS